MITKNEIKKYSALQHKKYRKESGKFLIQGEKIILEALQSATPPELIMADESWIYNHKHLIPETVEVKIAGNIDLQRISSLKTPPDVLGIMPIKHQEIKISEISKSLSIGLDFIQDPGNFGTILRIANWYGITHIFCSEDSVDYTNPKTIQASMGAFLRVNIHYCNLAWMIENIQTQKLNYSIYASVLEGENIHETHLNNCGMIIMGNEGNGISETVLKLCSHKITIPNYPLAKHEMESLNVAVASGIILSEFRRQANLQSSNKN
jgi:RNA methyltransferase, TrmH family